MPRGGQRIYVGNIPMDCEKRDLEKFFKGYGKLSDVVVINGYGFVEFEDARDADDACEDLDGKEIHGKRVKVEIARRDPKERYADRRYSGRDYRGGRGYGGGYRSSRGERRGEPPGPRTGNRLLVENISSRTSWQDLKDYFRTAGEISYTNVDRNGDGIVEFRDRKGLDYALKYRDELELDGRKLKVREEDGHYQSRISRRSRSRSRSKSRSRTRSNSRSGSKSRSRSSSNGRSHKRRPNGRRDRHRSSRDRSESKSRSTSRNREERRRHDDGKNCERNTSKSRSRSRS